MIQDTWEESHKFCPSCGKTLIKAEDGLECQACQFKVYNNPPVGVDVFIVEDGRILLGKRAKQPYKGRWDGPGGFVEPGETAEQAAIREIKEESNLDIEIIDYLGSCADIYGEINTLGLIYEAQIVGGEMRAQDDVAELKWFDLNDLPADEQLAFNSTKKGIEQLKKKYLKKNSNSND
jgi:8-oxo-dGTP diphosphatase